MNPGFNFNNPVGHLYGTFNYNNMTPDVQWTAVWLRGETIICYETMSWDGYVGGYGYTDCNPPDSSWLPGEYEVQIFVGTVWKQTGRFTVTGEPSTPRPTPTATRSNTPTRTLTLTRTLVPTNTNTKEPLLTLTP